MSSNLQLTDEDLAGLFGELDKLVTSVRDAKLLIEKKQLEVVARRQYKKARSALSAFNSEIKKCDDQVQKSVFLKKFHTYEERLKTADKTLKDEIHPPKAGSGGNAGGKAAPASREEELMGEGGADGSGFTSATQVLDAGKRINEDALKSLQRSERLQNSAEETGIETMTTLRKQTELMYKIDDDLQNLQGQLDRAKRDVMWFARRMAGDKCFMMLFAFLVFALLALVFYRVYSRRTGGSDDAASPGDDETLPPAAAATTARSFVAHALRRRSG